MKITLNERIVLTVIVLIGSVMFFRVPLAAGALTGRIAFYMPDPYRLFVINADGTSRYEVPLPYEQLPIVASPQWSADGSWLTFSGGAGLHSQIYIVRPDGSGFCRVTDGHGDLVCPSFSPDGSKIAYAQVNGHLYTIDAVCNAPPPTDHGINASHPRWSPDERYIVYTNWGLTYESDLFLYDLTTGNSTQITHHAPGQAFMYAAWSPDGTKLAVSVMDWTTVRSDVGVIDLDFSDPCNPLASDTWNLTADWPTSDEHWPSWSPDGQYIVFTSDISGNLDIWYSPVNHFDPVNITNSPEDEYIPAIGVPEPAVIEVTIDIKPGSCPNPLNVQSKGVLPVAVLGSEEFDVNSIDVASIRLSGVAPIRSSFEDVATPVSDGNECECTTAVPDGYTDLALKFKTQEIVEELGEVSDGDELVLNLTGVLYSGVPIEGADCIVARGKFKPFNSADLNKDGVVDTVDFALLAENWLKSSVVED